MLAVGLRRFYRSCPTALGLMSEKGNPRRWAAWSVAIEDEAGNHVVTVPFNFCRVNHCASRPRVFQKEGTFVSIICVFSFSRRP